MSWRVLLAGGLVLVASACSSPLPVPTSDILIESLPSCRAQRNCEWWGYNQSKLVRFGDNVVTYVIDNSGAPGTPYNFTMYQKHGDGPWSAGASMPTSRPGNLVVDADGVVHAFVFEAYDMAVNDSVGFLRHYTFATPGDITNYTEETVVDNDGTTETVNIRVGAAIASDGTLYTGFGLNLDGTQQQSEVLYERAPGATEWTRSLAATNLGHDFYYPYLLPVDGVSGGIAMFPIQDDYVGQNLPNIYQQMRYFGRDNDTWSSTLIDDLTGNPLAATRPALEQGSDIYQAEDGSVHALITEWIGADAYNTSTMRHDVLKDGAWTIGALDMPDGSCNWMRLFEIEGRMFTVCSTYDRSFIRAVGGTESLEVPFPGPITGAYPFLASPRGGTSRAVAYLDMTFVSGDENAYPNGPAFYVRIPKADLALLK